MTIYIKELISNIDNNIQNLGIFWLTEHNVEIFSDLISNTLNLILDNWTKTISWKDLDEIVNKIINSKEYKISLDWIIKNYKLDCKENIYDLYKKNEFIEYFISDTNKNWKDLNLNVIMIDWIKRFLTEIWKEILTKSLKNLK